MCRTTSNAVAGLRPWRSWLNRRRTEISTLPMVSYHTGGGCYMKVQINRAPVLTLWAAVVAQRAGHGWETALTLGKSMAGLNGQRKGGMLRIYETPEAGEEGAGGADRTEYRG